MGRRPLDRISKGRPTKVEVPSSHESCEKDTKLVGSLNKWRILVSPTTFSMCEEVECTKSLVYPFTSQADIATTDWHMNCHFSTSIGDKGE